MLDALSFIGAAFVLYCAMVGAWIVLRWGVTGVQLLWRKRAVIDAAVRADMELTLHN